MTLIRVVSGLAVRTDPSSGIRTALMGLRKPSAARPNLWELPGGKLEPGETPEEALAREWKEELGIGVFVGKWLACATLHLDITLVIELYEVRSLEIHAAKSLDHTELAWWPPFYAMTSLPCSPGFYLHYPQIERAVLRNFPHTWEGHGLEPAPVEPVPPETLIDTRARCMDCGAPITNPNRPFHCDSCTQA
jgi:8-oxo-dGTP pyrophosphatase MutT (NUDIX family)